MMNQLDWVLGVLFFGGFCKIVIAYCVCFVVHWQ